MIKTAFELRPGDTIKVWWSPGRDTIIALKPYNGPYDFIVGIAEFALLKSGMSLERNGEYETIEPENNNVCGLGEVKVP